MLNKRTEEYKRANQFYERFLSIKNHIVEQLDVIKNAQSAIASIIELERQLSGTDILQVGDYYLTTNADKMMNEFQVEQSRLSKNIRDAEVRKNQYRNNFETQFKQQKGMFEAFL